MAISYPQVRWLIFISPIEIPPNCHFEKNTTFRPIYIYISTYIYIYPYITLLVIYPVKYSHIPIKSHEEIIRSRFFASQSPAPWKCTWRIPPGTLWLVAYGSYGPLSISLSCRCSLHTDLRHLRYKMH